MIKINKDNIVKYLFFIIPSILAVIITIIKFIYETYNKCYYSIYDWLLILGSIYGLLVISFVIIGSFLAILEPFFRRNKRRSISMIIAIIIVGASWYLMNK